MDAECRENEKSEIAGILRAVRAAILFEAANCAPGVTPSIWDGDSDSMLPAAQSAIRTPEGPSRGRHDKESRQEMPTLSLFGGNTDGKGGHSKSAAREAEAHTAGPQTGVPWDRPTAAQAVGGLEALKNEIGPDCTRCPLGKLGRSKVVFGVGNPCAELMFVGEGPGEDEDRLGEPFVGRAGQLLTKMIQAMGLQRGDVYIANVVKCRPPKNRNPAWDEMNICGKFLERQIEVIRPRVMVALGKFSAMYLKGLRAVAPESFPISKYRGHFEKYKGADLMLTYHPSYLLRNQSAKKDVWEDLQQVMKLLGLQLHPRDRG